MSCYTRGEGVGEITPNVIKGKGGLKFGIMCHILFEWPLTDLLSLLPNAPASKNWVLKNEVVTRVKVTYAFLSLMDQKKLIAVPTKL
jgi:hypothetical protein